MVAKVGNGSIGLYRNSTTFVKSAADFYVRHEGKDFQWEEADKWDFLSMTLSLFGATTSVQNMVSGVGDAVKAYRQNEMTVKGMRPGNGEKGGSQTRISDLPENVQNSFNRYEEAGWQGNVSGQTPGTNAGRRWANRDSKLPIVDANGNPITYREFDVNNYNGFRRDGERFIIGSDGSAWYTDSHYGEGTSLNGIADFVKIMREK